ncbi:MAG: DUF2071 domain-containing protein, partial [Ferruginibacter sp.]|nr:DUF2071 domain-containing protein [Cytophagales bacterium]
MRLPLYLLKRHPFRIKARFDFSLVVTFAYPRRVLEPLLPPGLSLDTYGDYGFVAVALVKVRQLRPAWLPAAAGQDFFLSGYRLFTRFRTSAGRRLRGLYILRSDADQQRMVTLGSLSTHYRFEKATVWVRESDRFLAVQIQTPNRVA